MDEPSLSKVCDIFKCSKSSLFRWLKRFIETDDIENKSIKEGSYKVRQIHVNFIIKTIKQYPTITLNDILSRFHKNFNDIILSKTHLSNIIKFANLTYKKVQITHRPDTRYHKPINYNEEYKLFYSKIKKYNLDDIISIDETSISVGLHVQKGRE